MLITSARLPWETAVEWLGRIFLFVLTSPYYLSFRTYTYRPILEIMKDREAHGGGDNTKAERFLVRKAREVQHVQIMVRFFFLSLFLLLI